MNGWMKNVVWFFADVIIYYGKGFEPEDTGQPEEKS
jgi:hypothetical protein